ncbi:ECF family RNA polymerase sigma factor [Sorangium cellulosum]|uniref:ECF family RNA polymerase sigma factor n=1 Tax=Sorangium cellulosum TaxID=56 RepID=A0A4P2QCD2_SORCE|nr:RNA polymerase sigma factor [Sorangium cellulosum]AUX27375.1 ECF family RNA polymerase sigma factor [Sorangium cellulosum]
MSPRPQRARLRLVEPAAPAAPAAEALEDVGAVGPASAPEDRGRRDVQPGGARAEGSRRSVAPASGERGAGLTELPDAQLVILGARGDVSALEQLYRRHAAFAIHLATRIEGSARDVEDIVHDAFLRAFERLGDLVDPAAFRAWLGSIVVHKVRSRMRRARLLGLLGMGKSSEPVDLDALASPAASPHARAQIAQIYALLHTLPADDRIAWILRSVEGHELETVAQMCGCSLATVKRRISRAQQFLDGHFVDPTHNEVSP